MRKPLLTLMMLAVASMAMAQVLWKITAPGARPSYLFGTCHFVDVAYTDSIAGFNEAFIACDTLYTEIGKPQQAEMQQAMMNLGLKFIAQPSLGELLTPETARSLRNYIIERHGGDSTAVDADIQQINLAGLLMRYPGANLLTMMQTGSVAKVPMDMGLINLAEAIDVDSKALETIDYQLDLLGQFICDNTEEVIKNMIEGDTAADAAQIIADYKSEELDRLYSQFEQFRGLSNMEELIEGRNRRWTAKLRSALRGGGVFIGVGAGHLPGEQGLISMLRREGFTVEAVK